MTIRGKQTTQSKLHQTGTLHRSAALENRADGQEKITAVLPIPFFFNNLPNHATTRPLRHSHILQLQQQQGNAHVQRMVVSTKTTSRVQRCGGAVHPGCACAEQSEDESALPANLLQRQLIQRSIDLQLAPGSPYQGLPGGLLETIRRSIQQRDNTNQNLDNAFWAGTPPSIEVALDRCGTAGVNALAEIFQRTPSAIWAFVGGIRNIWSGSSRGFNFNCTDVAGLEGVLRGHTSFCRDTSTGESQHRPKRCWREVIAGGHGLHVCLHESAPCEIHIDLHQVVEAREENGMCNYAGTHLPGHWVDVFLGHTPSIFENVDRQASEIARLRSDILISRYLSESSRQELLTEVGGIQQQYENLLPHVRRLAAQGHPGELAAQQDATILSALAAINSRMGACRLRMLQELPEIPRPPGGRLEF